MICWKEERGDGGVGEWNDRRGGERPSREIWETDAASVGQHEEFAGCDHTVDVADWSCGI